MSMEKSCVIRRVKVGDYMIYDKWGNGTWFEVKKHDLADLRLWVDR